MNKLIESKFGSHVYGTNLPSSDEDFKGVFIPPYREIILQRDKGTIQANTKLDKNAKNSADDIDKEYFSLLRYCKLLAEGQTPALDLFFTPKQHWIQYSSDWEFILKQKDIFLSKRTESFVGYTRQQAAKYGVKGFRLDAVKRALEFLSSFKEYDKLINHENLVAEFVKAYQDESKQDLINIKVINNPKKIPEPHLEVCNRKVPYHATIKYAKEVYTRIWDEYGARARLAQENKGVDWKACSHAVRVAREAEELLLTGNITFPRPEAEFLLQIKKGELDFETKVAPTIEEGLARIEEAKAKSTLPEEPQYDKIDELVFDFYAGAMYETF